MAELQRAHPRISESVVYHRAAFRGFTGATGYNLPLGDPHADSVAHRLLAYTQRKRNRPIAAQRMAPGARRLYRRALRAIPCPRHRLQ